MGFEKYPPLPGVTLPSELKKELNKLADQGVSGAQSAIDRIARYWPTRVETAHRVLAKRIKKVAADIRMDQDKAQGTIISTGSEFYRRCVSDIAEVETTVVRAIDMLRGQKGPMQVSPAEQEAIRQRLAAGLMEPPKLSKLNKSQLRMLLSYDDPTLAALGVDRWTLITKIDTKVEDRLERLQDLHGLLQEIMTHVHGQMAEWVAEIREITFIPPASNPGKPRPTLPPARL